ncbi:MAG: DUF7931 domain-containing protein [Panacagrimonas sp.]
MYPSEPTPDTPAGMAFTPVSGHGGYADAALAVVASARHQLVLMTVDLDGRLYGSEVFVERLRGFILQYRRARLRVLVQEPAQAVRNCVRLVEFGRLLSSRIEFRQTPGAKRRLREEILIADERTMLYRGAPEQTEAKHYERAPLVARSHLRAFEALWQEAVAAREFSALGL